MPTLSLIIFGRFILLSSSGYYSSILLFLLLCYSFLSFIVLSRFWSFLPFSFFGRKLLLLFEMPPLSFNFYIHRGHSPEVRFSRTLSFSIRNLLLFTLNFSFLAPIGCFFSAPPPLLLVFERGKGKERDKQRDQLKIQSQGTLFPLFSLRDFSLLHSFLTSFFSLSLFFFF